ISIFHKSSISKKIFKHLIVSTSCGLIELCLFYLCNSFYGLGLLQSHIIGFTTATIFGFISHLKFTFKVVGHVPKRIFLFTLQVLLIMWLGYSILIILNDFLGNALIAKFFQLCLTFLINYPI